MVENYYLRKAGKTHLGQKLGVNIQMPVQQAGSTPDIAESEGELQIPVGIKTER